MFRHWFPVFVSLATLGVVSPAAADRWTEAQPMDQGRAQLCAVAIGNQIYVAGGTSVAGPVSNFDSYDPAAGDWHTLTPLPEGLQRFGMAVIGDQIIVSGGYSAKNSDTPSAKSWLYDTHTSQWRNAATMPGARAGHVLVTLNNATYVIGGGGNEARQVYRYDVAGDHWSTVFTPMPEERSGHAVAAIGNKIYVIGGQGADGKASASVFMLDTIHGTWSEGPKLPLPLSGHTASVIGNMIHVAGGASPPALKTSAAHYVLDPGKGGWQMARPLPSPRQGLASAVVGSRWYVIGGSAGAGFFSVFTPADTVEIYSSN